MNHTHKFKMGYVPGEGYRYCACGVIETVGPDGKIGKADAALKKLVKRNHGLK